ncbi:MAG: periplasmic heavy metal sensor [Desulfobacteraceae bacterium]|jgi:zinc resistance-associated protein
MSKLNKAVFGIVFLAIMGISTFAYAGWGRGPGHHRGYGPENCPGFDVQLTDKEREQVDSVREKFFTETKDLRDQLFDKRRALNDELFKETPNEKNAKKLQIEISDLQTQLDQKRLAHQLELKKINPKLGRWYGQMMGGGVRGGYGPQSGPGPCWR